MEGQAESLGKGSAGPFQERGRVGWSSKKSLMLCLGEVDAPAELVGFEAEVAQPNRRQSLGTGACRRPRGNDCASWLQCPEHEAPAALQETKTYDRRLKHSGGSLMAAALCAA